jgi:hypothetical protein
VWVNNGDGSDGSDGSRDSASDIEFNNTMVITPYNQAEIKLILVS